MIKYKVIKFNPTKLEELGKEDWQLCSIYEGIMYFSKKGTKTRTIKAGEETEERKEFIKEYKTIKNSGLSNERLQVKYNNLCKEGKHKQIMENLLQYKKYLEVKKKQEYALMAQTYISQSRYNDEWEVVEDMSKKWIDDVFKERNLDKYTITTTLLEIDKRESNKKKEVTSGVLDILIHYVQTGEIL